MKKLIIMLLAVIMLTLAACSSSDSATKYKDGEWTAEAGDYDEHSGWKDIVAVEIAEGKIVDVDWTAWSRDYDVDKKTLSERGEYGMEQVAQSPWHVQAELMEEKVVQEQGVSWIKPNSDGKIDTVSGVTMTVSEFNHLVQEALDKAKQ